ncbi:MAG: beta-aspartyl-peptidase, partial [Acidaminococcaceae bacterium]|nr:beta-aspartyl-peptidase [Acidaminococcaceae bacterium]
PADAGCQDILLSGRTIAHMAPSIGELPFDCTVLDAGGAKVTTGFIDQHIHITGGGEGSFATRVPEIQLSQLTTTGTTTVIGLLGTDGVTRSMENLLAKSRGLEEEGLSTWIYSGAYPADSKHITANLRSDILLIDKILGGKVAMSDHRSSMPTTQAYAELAAEARIGGMLSGKAGVLHIHMSDGKRGLDPVLEILAATELPVNVFRPTHVNRNPLLYKQAIEFALQGDIIDLTCGMTGSAIPVPEAVKQALDAGVPLQRLTLSSDGNGSMSKFNADNELIGLTAAAPRYLYEEMLGIVKAGVLPFEKALQLITCNIADALKLDSKGRVAVGKDADLIVWNDDLTLNKVFAKGRLMVDAGQALVKGTFEN